MSDFRQHLTTLKSNNRYLMKTPQCQYKQKLKIQTQLVILLFCRISGVATLYLVVCVTCHGLARTTDDRRGILSTDTETGKRTRGSGCRMCARARIRTSAFAFSGNPVRKFEETIETCFLCFLLGFSLFNTSFNAIQNQNILFS